MSDTTIADLQLPRFITVKQLAGLTQRNEFTIYHWLKREPHRLPRPTRALGRILFISTDVQAWIAQLQELPAPAPALKKQGRGRPTKEQQKAARAAAVAAATGGAA